MESLLKDWGVLTIKRLGFMWKDCKIKSEIEKLPFVNQIKAHIYWFMEAQRVGE